MRTFAYLAAFIIFFPCSYGGAITLSDIRYIKGIDGKASGLPFQGIAAIFLDSRRDELYIADDGNRRIVVTDSQGTFLYQFGYDNAKIKGSLSTIVVDKKGAIYVPQGDRVSLLNYKGDYTMDMDFSEVPSHDHMLIRAMAIDNDGCIYIADGAMGRIIVLDSDRKFLYQFFISGKPKGIDIQAMDVGDSKVYLLHPQSFLVTIFDKKKGEKSGYFGFMGESEGGFSMPADIKIDGKGRLVVVDGNRGAVIFFDKNGKFIFEFGGRGTFSWPRTVAIDKKRGIYYVVDMTSKVRVFQLMEDK
ncbi:MAG: hypothetical protein HY266_08560 [Deltaproteobacteria bacterium]|nr:hypothetical protein [Deltaproteobacteria bacterium]